MLETRYRSQFGTSLIALVVSCLITPFISHSIAAQALLPGSLDLTFGSGGIVRSPFGDSDGANAVVIQTDGKILAAGGGVLERYLRNGSRDNSFGNYGTAVAAIGIRALAIQSDGKIVAAGARWNGTNRDFGLARFNPDGSPDTSFGNQGSLTTVIPRGGPHTYDSGASGLAIQGDGRLVVSGGSGYYDEDWGWLDGVFATVRYNSDGSLDPTFGGGGIVTQPSNVTYFDASVVIQTNGKIIVAGSGIFACCTQGAVMRYNTNGSLDSTFSGGIVFTPSCCTFPATAIQPDGKIVLGGTKWISPQELDFAMIRFGSNGAIDTLFGNGGMVITPIGGYDASINSIAIQADGKIVAVGSRFQPVTFYDWAIVRYNPNGSLDGSYGTGGKVVIDVGGGSGYEYAHDIALDSIGRAVVVGDAGYSPPVALIRLLGDVAAPSSPEFDFDGDGRSDISVFRPANSVWYLNRSTDGFSATQFGLPADDIAPADYDGDRKTDIAVFRDGVWWRINSTSNTVTVAQFGQPGDIPVPADYTGDGRAEIAVYRNGEWLTHDLSNGQTSQVNFGLSTDQPVPADYDGDGKSDVGIFRPSSGEWWIQRSTDGQLVIQFGTGADTAVPADYTGDGKADIAVFRNTTGQWYIRRSEDSSDVALPWGSDGDIPVPGDYDGDGKVDAAIFRPASGHWWILQSSSASPMVTQFGITGDIPVPSAYVP